MPGQTIGTKLPPPKADEFSAHIVIRRQGDKHSFQLNYQGEEAIAKRVQTFLEHTIKELNGE